MGIDLSEISSERHVHEGGGACFRARVERDFFLHNQPSELRQALGIERFIVKVAGEPRGIEQPRQIVRGEVRDAGIAEAQHWHVVRQVERA